MIGRLHGTLVENIAPYLLVDVGGVGYEVEASMNTCFALPKVGEKITLLTHLIVREDAHRLYGFMQSDERELFKKLLKVNGIGAKAALAILSNSTVNQFIQSVLHSDLTALTKVPGVGKKTAERLLVEMADYCKKQTPSTGMDISAVPTSDVTEAVHALMALGYKEAIATKVIRQLDQSLSTQELIKQALREGVS